MTTEPTGQSEVSEELRQIEIRLDWSALDNVQASYANVSNIHHDLQHQSLVLTFGLALPPFHAISPLEGGVSLQKFKEAIAPGLPVTPVARVAMSPVAAAELLEHIKTNLGNYHKSLAMAEQLAQSSQPAT